MVITALTLSLLLFFHQAALAGVIQPGNNYTNIRVGGTGSTGIGGAVGSGGEGGQGGKFDAAVLGGIGNKGADGATGGTGGTGGVGGTGGDAHWEISGVVTNYSGMILVGGRAGEKGQQGLTGAKSGERGGFGGSWRLAKLKENGGGNLYIPTVLGPGPGCAPNQFLCGFGGGGKEGAIGHPDGYDAYSNGAGGGGGYQSHYAPGGDGGNGTKGSDSSNAGAGGNGAQGEFQTMTSRGDVTNYADIVIGGKGGQGGQGGQGGNGGGGGGGAGGSSAQLYKNEVDYWLNYENYGEGGQAGLGGQGGDGGKGGSGSVKIAGGSQLWNASRVIIDSGSTVSNAGRLVNLEQTLNYGEIINEGLIRNEGVIAGPGQLIQNSGSIENSGLIAQKDIIINGGRLSSGNGKLEGNVRIGAGAVLSSGYTSTTFSIDGDLTLLSGSNLRMAADSVSGDYDRIDISGTAFLGGLLDFHFLDYYYSAQLGDSFDILSANDIVGRFDDFIYNSIALDYGLYWGIDYLDMADGTDIVRLSVRDQYAVQVSEPLALGILMFGLMLMWRQRRSH